MEEHRVVPHDEWIETRQQFLAKEKEFTRPRDQLSRERRDLPWERVDTAYFEPSPVVAVNRESPCGTSPVPPPHWPP